MKFRAEVLDPTGYLCALERACTTACLGVCVCTSKQEQSMCRRVWAQLYTYMPSCVPAKLSVVASCPKCAAYLWNSTQHIMIKGSFLLLAAK